MEKKLARVRRARRSRSTIKRLRTVRLCIHRTPRHIYAQIIEPTEARVLACSSTLDKELKTILGNGGNVEAAKAVGKLVAERALKLGIKKVAFDRAGFKYHGRVKALADAAREVGLEF